MNTQTPQYVFKITTSALWVQAQTIGVLPPSPIDVTDGYMHFSTAEQARETLSLHFAGQDNLQLLRIDLDQLDTGLTWEASRGGQLFPHLYAKLPVSAIDAHVTISVSTDGSCDIPEGFL